MWTLSQDDKFLYYEAHAKSSKQLPKLDEDLCIKKLSDYFQLNVDLNNLVEFWCQQDKHITNIKDQFSGIRQLRQDPVENLFSFICSSNNNIKR